MWTTGKQRTWQPAASALMLATLLLLTVHKSKADDEEKGEEVEEAVARLTGAEFEELVLKGRGWAFVKFFAPWCQHCSDMGPAWAEMAAFFKKNPINGKEISGLILNYHTVPVLILAIKIIIIGSLQANSF